jgi:pimeloyl-ACP methyl ester carboxylesterase
VPEALVEGRKIRYDVAGSGEPALLLLHGWCDNRTQFHRLLPILAQKRRTLALDLPGHGASDAPPGDFGSRDLVAAAAAVVEQAGVRRVVPVAMAHAGWIAIGLGRRLRRGSVAGLVFIDWILPEPPRPFFEALQGLQDPERWKSTRAKLFAMWGERADRAIAQHVNRTMGDYGFGMWARSGREIAAAYSREGSPLAALALLDPPTPTLHLGASTGDAAALEAEADFALEHLWFSAKRLEGKTHFPALETPEAVASAIDEFVAGGPAAAAR